MRTILKEQKKVSEKKEFPEKKDLVYWILIILIFLSLTIAWRTRDPDLLISQISLGSTFLSILLAVVAIIFSFVQSNRSTMESRETLKELSNVTSQIISLNSIKDELSKVVSEYEKAIVTFNNKNEQVETTIGENKAIKINEINQEFKSKINSIQKQNFKTNKFLVRYRLKDKNYSFEDVILSINIPGLIKAPFSIKENGEDFEAEITTLSINNITYNQLYNELQTHLSHPQAEITGVHHIG